MRLLISMAALILISCGQQSTKEKTMTGEMDSTTKLPVDGPGKDSLAAGSKTVPATATAGELAVNASLRARFGEKWMVMNDRSANWMKDAFDYFIVPKRKTDPDYPYITRGDYNGDGLVDTAALVTDSLSSVYRLAILLSGNNVVFWEEDIVDDAAISTLVKPGKITGMSENNIEKARTVNVAADALEVVYFEKASFVLYWDKKKFKRLQTSD